MFKKLAFVIAPAAAAAVVATAAPAGAIGTSAGTLTTPRGQVISLDSLSFDNSGVATLSFTYQCVGTPTAMMWISLKQPKDGVAADWDLNSEGTSAQSSAWDSMHTAVPCSKGARPTPQQATFTIHDEYQVPGPFHSGPVFVQLCMTLPAGQNVKALGSDPFNPKSSADKSWKLALNYNWVDATVPAAG